uniref:Protein kinase domain-containing protein n=1 Tax=Panagrellus redivivus TaxID=6233 RepID=A0A7E4UTA5_PANRE
MTAKKESDFLKKYALIKPGVFDMTHLYADLAEYEEKPRHYSGRRNQMRVTMGQIIRRQYFVVRKAGFGVSSVTWLCYDKKAKDFVVLKILRNHEQDEQELKILKDIAEMDSEESQHFVKYLAHFQLKRIHTCIVFEPLGCTLRTAMNRQWSFAWPVVKKLLNHMLKALSLLNFDLNILHGDIKPENILVKCSKRSFFLETLNVVRAGYKGPGMNAACSSMMDIASGSKNYYKRIVGQCPAPEGGTIDNDDGQNFVRLLLHESTLFKLCDVGNAQEYGECQHNVATYEYRTPENVFRLPLTDSADIWSLAMTSIEALTGEGVIPYKEDDNENLLQGIVNLLGNYDKDIFTSPGYYYDVQPSTAKGSTPEENIAIHLRENKIDDTTIAAAVPIFAPMLIYDRRVRYNAKKMLRLFDI